MDSKHRPSPELKDTPRSRPRPPEEIVDSEIGKPGGLGFLGWIVLAIILLGLGGLLYKSVIDRKHQEQENQAAVKVEVNRVPAVQVVNPKRAPAASNLDLPGSVVAVKETTIYARTTGYVRRWTKDLGDRVLPGEVLAEIESPEMDQQLAQAQADLAKAQAAVGQARADLAKSQANLVQNRANLAKGRSDLEQAKANLEIARQTWQRWASLVQQGVVPQQAADEKQATYKANLASVQSAENNVSAYQANVEAAQASVSSSQANVNAAQASVASSQANVRRYAVLQSFEKVTAPYGGIVTARTVDSGALISSGGSNNTSLYKIAQIDSVNVNVGVPQTLVQSVQIGQTAQIRVPQLQNRVFQGKVIRTANSLDPNSRTLLTQLLVQNQDGALQPGMSTQVKFTFTLPNPPLLVPANVLVNNAGGMQVAIVTKDQTIHYQKVELGRDYGKEVEVRSGLQGNEPLVTNATTDLIEGTRVQTKAAQKEVKSEQPEKQKSK